MSRGLPPEVVAQLEAILDGSGSPRREAIEVSNADFEKFLAERIPPELREGAPPPGTWAGTAEEWESLRQQYEDAAREKLGAEFAEAVAVRGFTPQELATGTLQGGSEVNLMTGKVKRPPASILRT